MAPFEQSPGKVFRTWTRSAVICVIIFEMDEALHFEGEGVGEDNEMFYRLYDLHQGEVDHLRAPLKGLCSLSGCLTDLMQRVTESVRPHVEGYVWQCDAFCLFDSRAVEPPWKTSSDVDCLWGRLRYGDSVDEEWFVVSLLLTATKETPHLVAHVWDTDGEFLLIEAAFSLPKWIRPETSANRFALLSVSLADVLVRLESGYSEESCTLFQDAIPLLRQI